MIARAAVILVALFLVFWLGVRERDFHLQRTALHSALAQKPAAGVQSDLRAARFLNFDTQPDFLRAVFYYESGQRARGLAILRDVVRREPDNLTAWAQIWTFTRGHDPAAAREAVQHIKRLDPLDSKGI